MEPQTIQPNPDNAQPNEASPIVISPTTSEAVQPAPVVTEPTVVAPSEPVSLAASVAEPQQSAPTPLAVPKAKRKLAVPKSAGRAVVIVVIFVAGFFANVGLTKLSQHNANKTAHAFIAALNKGDNAKAYSYTTANFRQQESLSQFASAMGNLRTSNPKFSYESIGFNGSVANYASVEEGLPTTLDDTPNGTFAIALVKSGPLGWKIDSASAS